MNEYNEYRSARTLSFFVIGGLAIMPLTSIVSILISTMQIVSPGAVVDLEPGKPSSVWIVLHAILALARFPAYVATVVIFLIWLNRANKNLSPLGARNVEFSSGWAVGWWFIPFANLVKPFQVVREVWWDSAPDFDDEPTFLSASLKSAPTIMGAWWGFWIASNIFENVAARIYDVGIDAATVGVIFVISGALSTIAAFLAIKVVRDITRRQERRKEVVGNAFSDLPPAPPNSGGNWQTEDAVSQA
ncbi:MAG: DUF4328 domain-containing protein [Pyrinomonadaceae bacterium]